MVKQRRRGPSCAKAAAVATYSASDRAASSPYRARWLVWSSRHPPTAMRAVTSARIGYRPACAASTRARSFFAQASSAAFTCPQVAPPASWRIGLARALSRKAPSSWFVVLS